VPAGAQGVPICGAPARVISPSACCLYRDIRCCFVGAQFDGKSTSFGLGEHFVGFIVGQVAGATMAAQRMSPRRFASGEHYLIGLRQAWLATCH
jgi:hypothetical protein